MTKPVKHINRDEMKDLWRILERLQADVSGNRPVGWVWNKREQEALITVMDAVHDCYSLPWDEERETEPSKDP